MALPCGILAADASPPASTVPLAALVVLASLTAAEVVRQGGFFPRDAFVVAIASVALIAACFPPRSDRRALVVCLVLLGGSAWWLATAALHHRTSSYLPLGASMLGFVAGFLVIRTCPPALRTTSAQIVALIGAGTAAVGLAACALRWYPLAIPSQGLWRLATTLTYADAAGLLLGLAALVTLGLGDRGALVRIELALCVAGLIATQSRGALLATAVGLLFVPWRVLRRSVVPVGAGVVAGVVVVATSSGAHGEPLALAGVAVAVAIGGLVRPGWRPTRLQRRQVLVLGATAVVGAALLAAALHTPVDRRVQLASTTARVDEWRAALNQWGSSPWTGVGPDSLLHLGGAKDSFAYFAHNEYLQIGADAGLIGAVLLLAAAAAVARAIRRADDLSSCATGALVVFALAGAVDFDWHLTALAVLGGWAAGLASARPPDAVRTPLADGAEAPNSAK